MGQSRRVILVDTSAWVQFLRDTGSAVCTRVDQLLDSHIATCHPIRMEVLAGARDEGHLGDLRGLLARASMIPTAPTDFEDAAALYRACRRGGEAGQRLTDCLIAAIAIRADVPILSADADFEMLARHSALRIFQPYASVATPRGTKPRVTHPTSSTSSAETSPR